MLIGKLKTASATFVLAIALGAGLGTAGYGPLAAGQDRDGIRTPGRDDRTPAQFIPARPKRPAPPAETLGDAAIRKATADGKYTKLLKRIEVAEDRGTYGDQCDYGPWGGPSYAGHDNLPAGYWVYAYPHWYIWEALAEQPDLKKASVGGKYSQLLKKISVEEDRATYSEFHDYGCWSGASYAGHDNLPAGNWVYVYPNWYIWGTVNAVKDTAKSAAKGTMKGAAKDSRTDVTFRKASVNGKYTRLLKIIEVKGDRESYTDFSDFGHSAMPSYAGHDDLPAGYWVYVYPYWFIWGESAKDK